MTIIVMIMDIKVPFVLFPVIELHASGVVQRATKGLHELSHLL